MGTGKTSVGRALAARLGWPFQDMDEIIEKRAGMSIPDIFAQRGEAAFRAMEAALCQELADQPEIVISTGGGALVPEDNYAIMAERGLVVCLTCNLEEIWQRLEAVTDRPMLYGPERRARMERLLTKRAPAYNRISYQVDTGRLDVEEAVEQIIAFWGRELLELPVHTPTGDYVIHLGAGSLGQAGELWRDQAPGSRVGIVSNTTVAPLYQSALEGALTEGGFDVDHWTVPDGEQYKRLETVQKLYDGFIKAGLARDSAIWALGGGVVGDMAGFAAATYMRGVPFVQVPTSLLAMVDSSVGGKVAVDHPAGKNLIGAFKQPKTVIADPDVLETLPVAEYRAGLAEIVKAGIIDSPALFGYLERGGSGAETWPIAEAIRVKVDVVEEDPYERGRRAVLNLGHTFAHALELLSDYALRHGEAVSIGMAVAARVAVAHALAKPELEARILSCLRRHKLPTVLPDHAPKAIWQAMGSDKKRRGGRLRFVLPCDIGDVIVTDQVPQSLVLDVLNEMRQESL
jgi:3-dehydroquinate synthase